MKNIGILYTDDSLTVVVNGQSKTIHKSHLNYPQAVEAYRKEDWAKLISVLDTANAVRVFGQGTLDILDGVIKWNGENVNNVICNRIFDFMQKGLPYKPLLHFLENLMKNPSSRSVTELYTFLENKNLPITEDGCFLAYKAITRDWKDKFSRTLNNEIGQSPRFERNQVDDDCQRTCSHGLHVGALTYVRDYFCESAQDRIVIVKVNPADVVSVPADHNATKLRVCSYTVLSEYTGALPEPLYDGSGNQYRPDDYNKGGDDWGSKDYDHGDDCPDCGTYNSFDEVFCSSCDRELDI